MMLFLHGPSSFINVDNLCPSERKQITRKKKIAKQKAGKSEKYFGYSPFAPLYPFFPILQTYESISRAPLPSGFWLDKANGRHQQEIREWEKSEVWVLFPSSILTEPQCIKGCVTFQGHSSCRCSAINAVLSEFQSPLLLLSPSGCGDRKQIFPLLLALVDSPPMLISLTSAP